ncbi:MAG TPA: aldo/keto reductase [Rhizomicrobium sp.]|jgi:aryl-alcohol dehydrogenase-like predicted oxidoreductase|nr:aldo/keto reductase [Rhizomicrobium sp.]
MELRNVGSSGLKVSVVGLGCNNFGALDVEASRKVVHRALDLGVTLFDTADVYGNRGGSEEQLGAILGPRRKDIVLATKFGMPMDEAGVKSGASRRYIVAAVEASLTRLKTDWIDLYQLHRPDPATPMDETLSALDDLVRAGKVRYIGCSNLPGWQVADAQWIARDRRLASFVSAQDEYSLLVRDIEKDLAPALEAYDIGLLPYFPLASGLLTGKYKHGGDVPAGTRMALMKRLADRYMTDANWQVVDRLAPFCAARGHTLLELAFSWLAGRPQICSVIAGATRPEQVEANVKAVEWKLSADEIAEVDKLTKKS